MTNPAVWAGNIPLAGTLWGENEHKKPKTPGTDLDMKRFALGDEI